MERTIVTPQSTDLHISIPQKYVGKRVEVIFFDVDEETANMLSIPNSNLEFVLDDKKRAILDMGSSVLDINCINGEESLKRLKKLL